MSAIDELLERQRRRRDQLAGGVAETDTAAMGSARDESIAPPAPAQQRSYSDKFLSTADLERKYGGGVAAPPADDDSWEVTKGLKRGGRETLATIYGAGASLASLLGNERTAEALLVGYQENMELAQEHAATIQGIEEINIAEEGGLDRAATWLLGVVGAVGPSVASMFTGAGAGAVLAKGVTKKVITRQMKKKMGNDVAKKLATEKLKRKFGEEGTKKIVARATKLGATAGGYAASSTMETGGTWGEMQRLADPEHPDHDPDIDYNRPDVAILSGMTSGALELIVPMRVLGKFKGVFSKAVIKELKKPSVLKELVKTMPSSFAGEAATEFAQEFIQEVALKVVDERRDLFSEEAVSNYMNAAAAGGVIGLGFGGAGGAGSFVGKRMGHEAKLREAEEEAVAEGMKTQQVQEQFNGIMQEFDNTPAITANVPKLQEMGERLSSDLQSNQGRLQVNASEAMASIEQKIRSAEMDLDAPMLEVQAQEAALQQRTQAAVEGDPIALSSEMEAVAQDGADQIVKGVEPKEITPEPSAKAQEGVQVTPAEGEGKLTVATEKEGVQDGLESAQQREWPLGGEEGITLHRQRDGQRGAERTGVEDQQKREREVGERAPTEARTAEVSVPLKKGEKKPRGRRKPTPISAAEKDKAKSASKLKKEIRDKERTYKNQMRHATDPDAANPRMWEARAEKSRLALDRMRKRHTQLIQPKKARGAAKPKSVLRAIKAMGGINLADAKFNVDPQDFKGRGVLKAKGGKSFDQVITSLREDGFNIPETSDKNAANLLAEMMRDEAVLGKEIISAADTAVTPSIEGENFRLFGEQVDQATTEKELLALRKEAETYDSPQDYFDEVDWKMSELRSEGKSVPFSLGSGNNRVAPFTLVPGQKAPLLTQLEKQSGTKIDIVVPKQGDLALRERIKETLKMNTVFFVPTDGRKVPINGFSDKSTGTIYVNVKADNYAHQVVWHEVGHQITEDASFWAQISPWVDEQITSSYAARTSFDNYISRLEGIPEYLTDGKVDRELAKKEWFSDYMSEHARDSRVFGDLARFDQNIFERVSRMLLDSFKKIGAWLTGSRYKTENAFMVMDRAKTQLDSILYEYTQDAKTLSETANGATSPARLRAAASPYQNPDAIYKEMQEIGNKIIAESPHIEPMPEPGFDGTNSLPNIRYSVMKQGNFTEREKAIDSKFSEIAPKDEPRSIHGSTFKDQIDRIKSIFITQTFDKYYQLSKNAAQAGLGLLDPKSGYNEVRKVAATDQSLGYLLEDGMLELKDDNRFGDKTFDGGFNGILKDAQGLDGDLLKYRSLTRSEYDIKRGLKTPWTAEQIVEGKKLYTRGMMPDGKTSKAEAFKKLNDRLTGYFKGVLDLQLKAGTVNWEASKRFNPETYIPNYRIDLEEVSTWGVMSGDKIANPKEMVRAKGGTGNLKNLYENSVNYFYASLLNARKNIATRESLEVAAGLGQFELMEAGWKPGKEDKALSYLDNGEPIYYRAIEDNASAMLTYEALMGMSQAPIKFPFLNVMKSIKQFTTRVLTSDPGFVFFSNAMRELTTTPHYKGASMNVAANLVTGLKEGSIDSKYFREMKADGAVFTTGIEVTGQRSLQRYTQRLGLDAGNTLDNPKGWQNYYGALTKWGEKAFGWYFKAGSRIENQGRVAMYISAQKQGYTKGQALMMSRDVLDFGASGASSLVQLATSLIPFLNSRLQGWYKFGRESGLGEGEGLAKIIPKGQFLLFSSILASLSVMEQVINYGDEEYENEPDWRKDTNWIWTIGDKRFYIPKPFELGVPGTVAGLVTKGLIDFTNEVPIDTDRYWDYAGRTISSSFGLQPPAFIGPTAEVIFNTSFFYGTNIENPFLRSNLLPSERASRRSSEFSKSLSKAWAAIDPSEQEIFSPSAPQIDHWLKGHTGWIGTEFLKAFDMVYDSAFGEGESPAITQREFPVWGKIMNRVTNDPKAKNVQSSNDFYTYAENLRRYSGTFKKIREDGRLQEAGEFRRKHVSSLALVPYMNRVSRQISKLSKRIKRIEDSPRLSGDQKTRMIDKIRKSIVRMTVNASERAKDAKLADRRRR